MFRYVCVCVCARAHARDVWVGPKKPPCHTDTYIYIYVCVYVHIFIYKSILTQKERERESERENHINIYIHTRKHTHTHTHTGPFSSQVASAKHVAYTNKVATDLKHDTSFAIFCVQLNTDFFGYFFFPLGHGRECASFLMPKACGTKGTYMIFFAGG